MTLKLKVCKPLPVMARSVNVATPLMALTFTVPLKLPLPLALLAVTSAVDEVIVAPLGPMMRTTGWPPKAEPERAAVG